MCDPYHSFYMVRDPIWNLLSSTQRSAAWNIALLHCAKDIKLYTATFTESLSNVIGGIGAEKDTFMPKSKDDSLMVSIGFATEVHSLVQILTQKQPDNGKLCKMCAFATHFEKASLHKLSPFLGNFLKQECIYVFTLTLNKWDTSGYS